MAGRIIICTRDDAAWRLLREKLGAIPQWRLHRVDRMEDAVQRGATTPVAAAVVDDRFLSVLPEVEASLRRFSPLFHDTVVMTVGEALTAGWIGLLDDQVPSNALLSWVAHERTARGITLAWH